MLRRFLSWMWPSLFGQEPMPEVPVKRIVLPPEPMFKAPDEDEWRPL